jgi:hypothetical protein
MIRDSFTGKTLFSDKELKCKCCGFSRFADGFEDKLRELRMMLSEPMTVTSCCRCEKHNKESGGAKGSYHLVSNSVSDGTCAVDIARRHPEYDARLIQVALSLGWSLGLAKTFIHLDRRVDFGQQRAIYTY